MGIGPTLANGYLNALYRATSFSVTTPYFSLHTADPGTTGANEVSGGSYARQSGAGKFAAAASSAIASNAAITWTVLPAVTVTHVAVWDASSGGNFLRGGALTNSRTVEAGGSLTINSGNLTDALS